MITNQFLSHAQEIGIMGDSLACKELVAQVQEESHSTDSYKGSGRIHEELGLSGQMLPSCLTLSKFTSVPSFPSL